MSSDRITIRDQSTLTPLATITPYWRNPRHSDRAVAAVKESIEQFGFNVPLVVDGENVIITGHTRYRAAMELGLEQVPVIAAADLTPEQVRAYRIADNKTSELATWDHDRLMLELRELPNIDVMSVYFPETNLNELLGETAGAGFAPPTAGDLTSARDKLGDRFTQASKEAKEALVEVTCPECGTDFAIERAAVLKRTDLGKGFTALEVVLHDEQREVIDLAIGRVRKATMDAGATPHANPGVWLGQVLEALAAEYLAGPDQ